MKIKITLLAMAVFTSISCSALNYHLVTKPLKPLDSSVWVFQSQQNGVKLFYKVDVCSNKNVIFLKFENTTVLKTTVSYNIIVESPGSNIPLFPQFIILQGNEIKEGDCNWDTGLTFDIKTITNPGNLRVIMNVQ
jgi:hypothetical protein